MVKSCFVFVGCSDFGYSPQGGKCVQESWFDDGYIATNCTEGVNISKSQGSVCLCGVSECVSVCVCVCLCACLSVCLCVHSFFWVSINLLCSNYVNEAHFPE